MLATTQPLFPSPQRPQPFQHGSPFFSQQQQLQFPQQTKQQQTQQQLFLFTNDKAPANYSTKWADLHPDSQKFLLQIEEKILEYRDESQRLDQCSRLYDSSVSNVVFELDASHIVQELRGIKTAVERQRALLQELMTAVKDMLRNAEVAVHSFMMIRPRFLHPNKGGASNASAPPQASGATATPGSGAQLTANSIVPISDFYPGIPKKPSPFLRHTIDRFEKHLAECQQRIEELEQLPVLDADRNSINKGYSLLQSFPKVMSNVQDFFIHVAAKVESIHQYIESMKNAYLADQRRHGDGNDPFLAVDRRETAKQEAAAKRVHRTLHLPANSQPSTYVAGLFASSATPGMTTVPQISKATTAASSSGSCLSLLSTPSSASASSMSSLFTTPTTGVAQSSLFSPSPSSGSLLGSGSTPSLFVSTTPTFSATAYAGAPLFSTPFASGAATGSGASFGAASKSSRPKS